MDHQELINLRITADAATPNTVLVVKKDTILELYHYIDTLTEKIKLLQQALPKVYQRGVAYGKNAGALNDTSDQL